MNFWLKSAQERAAKNEIGTCRQGGMQPSFSVQLPLHFSALFCNDTTTERMYFALRCNDPSRANIVWNGARTIIVDGQTLQLLRDPSDRHRWVTFSVRNY